MIRTYALHAAAAIACALVIIALMGGNEARAVEHYAGGDALALAAPCLTDALARAA